MREMPGEISISEKAGEMKKPPKPKPKPMRATVTVSIPIHLLKHVDDVAAKIGAKRSHVIAGALAAHFGLA